MKTTYNVNFNWNIKTQMILLSQERLQKEEWTSVETKICGLKFKQIPSGIGLMSTYEM